MWWKAPWSLGRVVAALVVLASVAQAAAAQTFDLVRSRGTVVCGLPASPSGLTERDDRETGREVSMGSEFCRAVAAATLGDARRITLVSLPEESGVSALESGAVDVLFQNWTLVHDGRHTVDFTAVIFYDSQAFLARRSQGFGALATLRQPAVACIASHAGSLSAVQDYIHDNALSFLSLRVFPSRAEAGLAFLAGDCAIYVHDASVLASVAAGARSSDPTPEPTSAFVILPERIGKKPLGAGVRSDDNSWFDLVKWVVFATIAAEEYGLTATNVDQMMTASDPTLRRLLGAEPGLGAPLRLDDGWAYRIIRQVGSYGEIFARVFAMENGDQPDRGLNALWTQGGLLYAMPLR